MSRTYRQGAWYDWGCQPFVSLERTWRNSSNGVYDHVPPDSGWKRQRKTNEQQGARAASWASMCGNLPAWIVVPAVAFFIAPACKRWRIEYEMVLTDRHRGWWRWSELHYHSVQSLDHKKSTSKTPTGYTSLRADRYFAINDNTKCVSHICFEVVACMTLECT